MKEKWLYGPEKFPGLSRNGPQARDIVLCSCPRVGGAENAWIIWVVDQD